MQMEGSRCSPFASHESPRDIVVSLYYRLNSIWELIDFLDHEKSNFFLWEVTYGSELVLDKLARIIELECMIIGFCKVSCCLKFYGHYIKPVKTEVTLKKEGYFSFSQKFSSYAEMDEHFFPLYVRHLALGK